MGRRALLVTLSAGLLGWAESATDARFILPPPEGRLGRPVAEGAGRLRGPVAEAIRLRQSIDEASRLGTEVAGSPQVVTEHFSRVQPGLVGEKTKLNFVDD